MSERWALESFSEDLVTESQSQWIEVCVEDSALDLGEVLVDDLRFDFRTHAFIRSNILDLGIAIVGCVWMLIVVRVKLHSYSSRKLLVKCPGQSACDKAWR